MTQVPAASTSCSFREANSCSPTVSQTPPNMCTQARASRTCLSHIAASKLYHASAQLPPPSQGVACPSPRWSGVLGTAGTGPTRRNRHSRRIASAAKFSSAVQMMIKCYCARENGKEGFISFIVRKDSWAPVPRSKSGLTPCVLGCLAGMWVSRD